ncbi:hypothetical protein [Undibacterium sp.]|uniref:hypothetical protein n=1 Tax=Undibacterium sp. TaxID=1914977 RepID=UPI00374D82D3
MNHLALYTALGVHSLASVAYVAAYGNETGMSAPAVQLAMSPVAHTVPGQDDARLLRHWSALLDLHAGQARRS